MARDNSHRTHPWRATLLRDVTISIGWLTVQNIVTGTERVIEQAPTQMDLKAGTRMFRTKKAAAEFVESYRRDHGHDIVSDVFRA